MRFFLLILCFLPVFIQGCASTPESSLNDFRTAAVKQDYNKAWLFIDDNSKQALQARGIMDAESFRQHLERLLANGDYRFQFENTGILSSRLNGDNAVLTIEFPVAQGKEKKELKINMVKRGLRWKISL